MEKGTGWLQRFGLPGKKQTWIPLGQNIRSTFGMIHPWEKDLLLMVKGKDRDCSGTAIQGWQCTMVEEARMRHWFHSSQDHSMGEQCTLQSMTEYFHG